MNNYVSTFFYPEIENKEASATEIEDDNPRPKAQLLTRRPTRTMENICLATYPKYVIKIANSGPNISNKIFFYDTLQDTLSHASALGSGIYKTYYK